MSAAITGTIKTTKDETIVFGADAANAEKEKKKEKSEKTSNKQTNKQICKQILI